MKDNYPLDACVCPKCGRHVSYHIYGDAAVCFGCGAYYGWRDLDKLLPMSPENRQKLAAESDSGHE
jgi:hypothetical protein